MPWEEPEPDIHEMHWGPVIAFMVGVAIIVNYFLM